MHEDSEDFIYFSYIHFTSNNYFYHVLSSDHPPAVSTYNVYTLSTDHAMLCQRIVSRSCIRNAHNPAALTIMP
jgi:hypothetical protein